MTEVDTQQIILQTARKLFMEFGYRAVSTRRIADACGLTQPALYHHYANKQTLYLAVLTEMLQALQVALERIVRRNESVQTRLEKIALFLLEQPDEGFEIMLHDIAQELSRDARERINKRFYAAMITPIAGVFAEGFASGKLLTQNDRVQPVSATFFLLSLVKSRSAGSSGTATAGGAFPSEEQHDRTWLAKRAETLVHVLLHGLSA